MSEEIIEDQDIEIEDSMIEEEEIV